ncbi:MAG: hypothetical protein K2I64_01370 [Muribaculaceae bacterium]|nr:hypothetical protein [Muribaculaceae bacterium]
MKLTQFIKYSAVLTIFLQAGSHKAVACGPYYDDIPTPSYFQPLCDYNVDYDRKTENLEQWRALTAHDIPLADIDSVVYKAPLKAFLDSVKAPDSPGSNRFYSYLRNTHDSEAADFLTLAKEIETYRAGLASPWYYPSSRLYMTETDALNGFTDRCLAYGGTRLRDRYGLQAVRALFASRQYERCIATYDSIFADLPADNLFRRMSLDYVTGCMENLGLTKDTDDYYDEAGAVLCIADKEGRLRDRRINVNAPEWIYYIRREIDHIDQEVLWDAAQYYATNKDVANKGDWYYILAYLAGEKFGKNAEARRFVDAALKESFTFNDFAGQAHAYRLKISGRTGDMTTLLDDLRWIESRINSDANDNRFWSRILQNAVYTEWVPTLWDKGRYADMALLCSYADKLGLNYVDSQYGTLSFRLLESLKAKDVAQIGVELQKSTPLYRHLKRHSGLTPDFMNELTGTLAMREGNYQMAVNYLSGVSPRYLEGMNIYNCNYLSRNPFFQSADRVMYCDMAKKPLFREFALDSYRISDCAPDSKLRFARQMLKLDRIARTTQSPDVKAMAQYLYACGHYSSFENCWALTQYWKGEYCGIFYPYMLTLTSRWKLEMPDGKCFTRLFDYERSKCPDYVKSLYGTRFYELMDSDASDEVKAEIEYLAFNLADVCSDYEDTYIAQIIRTHCDGLKDWAVADSDEDE